VITIPKNIPVEKRLVLTDLIQRLAEVKGIQAIVLGGSYARGLERPDSDMDMGIYYYEDQPFKIEDIRSVASALSEVDSPVVTGFYEWGAWVNGGAWVHTSVGKIDFLYRNINHVQKTIDEGLTGIIHLDFNQQPPFGFFSVIYLAETNLCIPLHDPKQILQPLKSLVKTYPPILRDKIQSEYLWMAEFTLLHARGFASRGDVYNTAGCLTRISSYLTQVLFAMNQTYFIADKTAMAEISGFSVAPRNYREEISAVFGNLGISQSDLEISVAKMESIWKKVAELAQPQYQPKFVL
jgi:predicted nucleotidyltransferase